MENALITIESDTFTILRNDINMILKRTLENMINKSGDNAEVKVSLKINLNRNTVPDDNEVLRDILIPRFDHKVTSTLQYKAELNGFVDGSDYELVWDPDVMEYVMRPIQDSLFDEEEM